MLSQFQLCFPPPKLSPLAGVCVAASDQRVWVVYGLVGLALLCGLGATVRAILVYRRTRNLFTMLGDHLTIALAAVALALYMVDTFVAWGVRGV
jgi:hypothetical protein